MKTYYLQMESSDALVPSVVEGLCLRIIDPPDGRVNQRFYREVGGRWDWADCAEWSAERWTNHLESNPISTIVLQIDGEEIGYSEMINRNGDVEILSFGLLEQFIGKGLGSAALTIVVQYAWTLGAVHHVWLHTCEKDHPNALNNYQRRGFVLYDTKDKPAGKIETGSQLESRD